MSDRKTVTRHDGLWDALKTNVAALRAALARPETQEEARNG